MIAHDELQASSLCQVGREVQLRAEDLDQGREVGASLRVSVEERPDDVERIEAHVPRSRLSDGRYLAQESDRGQGRDAARDHRSAGACLVVEGPDGVGRHAWLTQRSTRGHERGAARPDR